MKTGRNEKGQFVKGHLSVKFWKGKKRLLFSKKWKENIGKGNKDKVRTLEMKENYRKSKLGEKNPMYKNGRMVVQSGHILILKKDHPFCNVNGRVFEHRLVMEEKLGRYLKGYEHIHHIDGNPSNNNISNLFLTTRSENTKAHNSLNKLLEGLLKDKIIKFNKETKKYERI